MFVYAVHMLIMLLLIFVLYISELSLVLDTPQGAQQFFLCTMCIKYFKFLAQCPVVWPS